MGTEFKGDEIHPSGAVVMFELKNGIILALYSRVDLAKDAKQPVGPTIQTEFSIGQFLQNKQEVDDVLQQAKVAGSCD